MSFLGDLKDTVEDGKEIARETRDHVEEEIERGKEFNSQATGFEPSPLEAGMFGKPEPIEEEKEGREEDPRVSINIY